MTEEIKKLTPAFSTSGTTPNEDYYLRLNRNCDAGLGGTAKPAITTASRVKEPIFDVAGRAPGTGM